VLGSARLSEPDGVGARVYCPATCSRALGPRHVYPALPQSLLRCSRAQCGTLRAARALIPDDDDEELIEKAKANRKLRLASQKEVEGEFKKSGGFAEGEARLPWVTRSLGSRRGRPASVLRDDPRLCRACLLLWSLGRCFHVVSPCCTAPLHWLAFARQVVVVQRAVNKLARSGEALAAGDLPTVAATVTWVALPPHSCTTVRKAPRHCPLYVAMVMRLMAFTLGSCGLANARGALFAVHAQATHGAAHRQTCAILWTLCPQLCGTGGAARQGGSSAPTQLQGSV